MRVASLVIDRLNEEDFRRSIENRLRERQAIAAIERLRRLLAPYAGPGGILPERFLTVGTGDLVLSGWDALDESIRRHDRPDSPITAISIAFGWPGSKLCGKAGIGDGPFEGTGDMSVALSLPSPKAARSRATP